MFFCSHFLNQLSFSASNKYKKQAANCNLSNLNNKTKEI